jgi:hypothetical protein
MTVPDYIIPHVLLGSGVTVQVHCGNQLVQGALSSWFEQPNVKLLLILFHAKIK